MNLPPSWQIRLWEQAEAKLAPAWAMKYARQDEVAEVRTEGAQPAAADMPPDLAEKYAELARTYNAQREIDRSELDAQIEADAQAAADREQETREEIFAQRESTFIRHVKNRAGRIVSAEAAAKAHEARAQLDEDSIDMALKLESVGRPAFGSGPQAWLVGAVSGEIKPLINIRKRAILPAAAAQKRAPMVNAQQTPATVGR